MSELLFCNTFIVSMFYADTVIVMSISLGHQNKLQSCIAYWNAVYTVPAVAQSDQERCQATSWWWNLSAQKEKSKGHSSSCWPWKLWLNSRITQTVCSFTWTGRFGFYVKYVELYYVHEFSSLPPSPYSVYLQFETTLSVTWWKLTAGIGNRKSKFLLIPVTHLVPAMYAVHIL